VLAHYFHVSEETVYQTWTEDRFRRYQDFAEALMKRGDRG